MVKEFFDDFQIDKKDFKDDTNKTEDINRKLRKEKFNLEEYRNKELFYSSNLSEIQNILNKFALKQMGKELVKAKDYDKAVIYFESLLDNPYFENDYYVYRQLAINYTRTKPKQFDKQLKIIKEFFKSGIYCSHNQYLWFSNKLFDLRDKKLITTDEINEYSKYFKQNGKLNKDKENLPVVLAERIFQSQKGYVGIDDQYSYERKQIRQELEFIGQQYKNNKDYENVVGFYNDVFEFTNFDSIRMYELLIDSLEKLGDYWFMLATLSVLFKKNYIRGETTKKKFDKKLKFVNKKLGTSYTIEDLRQLDFDDLEENQRISVQKSNYEQHNTNNYENSPVTELLINSAQDSNVNEYDNINNENLSHLEIFLKYADLYEKGLISKDEFGLIKKEFFSQINNDSVVRESSNEEINSNNEKPAEKIYTENKITVASYNLKKLLKSNVGDEIIVKMSGTNKTIVLQIIDIKRPDTRKNPENNIININEDNFNYLEKLNLGDLVLIKTKNRSDSATLKIIGKSLNNDLRHDDKGVDKDLSYDDLATEKDLKYVDVSVDNDSKINDMAGENKNFWYENFMNIEFPQSKIGISKPIDKYLCSFRLSKNYDLDLDNPFEFDENLTNKENIARKFILKRTGSKLNRPDEAADFFEKMKYNSYFENDWYPYRQLAIIYYNSGKNEENIRNIKELFYSGIYLNGAQYVWFINKLYLSLNSFPIDQKEYESWIDYYWENGAKNKEKLDTPVFIADRIVGNEISVNVYTKEQFYCVYQFLDELKGKVNFAEKTYDYENELNAIISYFTDYYSKISHKNVNWFKNKLTFVNKKLCTNYKYTDFL